MKSHIVLHPRICRVPNSSFSVQRWRLPLLLPLLVILGGVVESRRFGFPAKTIHFPDIVDDRILELDEKEEKSSSGPHGEDKSSSSSSSPQILRSRRSAAGHWQPPKVTLATLNTTQHKVVVHWAGEGSKVIIALATGILGSR